ncbi:Gag pol protein [Elysia marginata]|uniref:Gag pol protein n=1 Tax=Elysia marginata TaxID=1093978 RepID=A0AAV4I0D0_9GAST|nr:Gag pol protein [Elysia marginata]
MKPSIFMSWQRWTPNGDTGAVATHSPATKQQVRCQKEFLISAFGLTDEKRASTLLDLRGLGDYKPSELMDNMLSLLGGHTPCFLFKQIFMRQLPDQVRASLATSATSDYRALALEADKLFLAMNPHTTSLCSAPLSCSELKVESLCWYHRKYGSSAKKCQPSCQLFNTLRTRETPGRANSNVVSCWPA